MNIIQVATSDRRKVILNLPTRTFFILHERLDEEILRKALDSLIRDHWRKLGARLTTRPKDGLPEYHLPQTFEEKYVLFNWTSKQYDHSIERIASFLKPTAPEMGFTLLPPLSTVEESFRPSNWPLNVKGNTLDTPLLYVHVSLFGDASVIAISMPHMVGDQFGKANIMKAWLGLIKGEAPPPMVGVDGDFLTSSKPYNDYPQKDIRRKERMKVARWGEYPLVILGYLPELIRDRKEDAYIMFLPLLLVESLRQRHGKALAEKYGADPSISNGDIVSGILLKVCSCSSRENRSRRDSQF